MIDPVVRWQPYLLTMPYGPSVIHLELIQACPVSSSTVLSWDGFTSDFMWGKCLAEQTEQLMVWSLFQISL